MRALLVEHGTNRGGLAAARELQRAGWSVSLVCSGAALTARSHSVGRVIPADYPAGGASRLVATVQQAIRESRSEVVFPVDETQLLALSARRDELGAVLPFPAHAVLERATDRLEQARAAEQAGLRPPRTDAHVPDGVTRVAVKARRPALLDHDGDYGRIETRIGSPGQARSWMKELSARGIPAVAQEAITGRLSSLTLLADERGAILGQVQQVASHIWPPGAGTSARATTVPVDPDLSRRVLMFFEALGWHGFAQVQFLIDDHGQPHLIDFNPRFYGSLALAIRAGVNFPVLWAEMAIGRTRGGAEKGRPGVRYQWLGGDLRRAVRERQGGLPRDLAQTAVWGVAGAYPIWSLRDPAPAVRSALELLGRTVGA